MIVNSIARNLISLLGDWSRLLWLRLTSQVLYVVHVHLVEQDWVLAVLGFVVNV